MHLVGFIIRAVMVSYKARR